MLYDIFREKGVSTSPNMTFRSMSRPTAATSNRVRAYKKDWIQAGERDDTQINVNSVSPFPLTVSPPTIRQLLGVNVEGKPQEIHFTFFSCNIKLYRERNKYFNKNIREEKDVF